jgi:hypothetical protein
MAAMVSSSTRALYRDTGRPRCCALLKLPFSVHCSRRASVERNGRFYCGQHDPLRARASRRKTSTRK